MTNNKAIVLLSGGLDSATALAWAQQVKGWRCHALAFDYGQRHRRELKSARVLSRAARCPLKVLTIQLPWGGSSLLKKEAKPLPSHRLSQIGRGKIPSTYVPARNTLFMAFALSWADALGAGHIVIGANILDYSGYPDCRPSYYKAFQSVARLGTRLGTEQKKAPRLCTPLIRWNKAQIIRKGLAWGVNYGKTWSCYQGHARPCGRCDSCRLRQKGFEEAGASDPLLKKRRNK